MAAPTLELQTLQQDANQVVVKIDIPTGGDADVSAVLVCDISGYTVGATPSSVVIEEVISSLSGFNALLLWDADADTKAMYLAEGSANLNFKSIGGITSDAGAGATGDIRLSTSGIGATDAGTIILKLKKIV